MGGGNIITFAIDGIEYQAEEGMTWGEWIESEYNTDGWYINNYNFILSDSNEQVYGVNDDLIYQTDTISNNETYFTGMPE